MQNFVHAGAAPLSALRAGIPPTAASAVAPRPCSLGVTRVFCALPPTFYGLSPTAAVLHARDPHRRVLEVRTLLDPTTGPSTLVPECRAAPCNRGTAVDLLLRVRGHYAPRGASPQVPNKCLTRAKCSVTLEDMHNQNTTRLTARRIELLIAALTAEEASLIDDEAWRYSYPSEKAARAEIDATREWLYAQLRKRQNKAAQ